MLLPAPSTRASLAKMIADTLRAEIFSGFISPGEPIVELGLAARFQASRAPVREAMSKLTAEGLLQLKSNGRTIVCSLEQKDFVEILDTRSALESMAARRAAPHWAKQDSDAVREIIERQRNSQTLAELSQLDVEMHTFMVSRCGNGRLFGLWQQIRGQFSVCLAHTHRIQTGLDFDPKKASVQLHLELLKAFESRDGDTAAAAATAHVEIWGSWLPQLNLPASKESRKLHSRTKREARILPLLFLGFLGVLSHGF
jgi:DNA-binding GntR family transcriptional regulator